MVTQKWVGVHCKTIRLRSGVVMFKMSIRYIYLLQPENYQWQDKTYLTFIHENLTLSLLQYLSMSEDKCVEHSLTH